MDGLHKAQEEFVETMLGYLPDQPLMRKGRGAGKSYALRSLAAYLNLLADFPHDEFVKAINAGPETEDE